MDKAFHLVQYSIISFRVGTPADSENFLCEAALNTLGAHVGFLAFTIYFYFYFL